MLGLLAVPITLFGTVRIRNQKKEDTTLRGKFDQSEKSEFVIVQKVSARPIVTLG